MYEDHFQFIKEPFSIAPDPDFLFLSDVHNEALAHLMYGFSHGGFVLITGEVGTGKTTLLRNLLDRTPADLDVAFILNPRLTVKELLETICEELGVPLGDRKPESVKQYIDRLNRHLLKTHQAGRSTVVIIDEAQNLSPAVLEQIRLLTNLETNEKKLLRIILLGQPELAAMLSRTELRQLAQRITARYHLESLSKTDVGDYVQHRLVKAGGSPNIFTKGAVAALYRASKGTPRLINVVADRALLGAYTKGVQHVDARLVRQAAKEVFGADALLGRTYWIGATTIVVVVGMVMAWAYLTREPRDTVTATTPSVSERARSPAPSAAARRTDSGTPAATMPAEPVDGSPSIDQTTTRPASAAPPPVTITRPEGSTYHIQRKAFSNLFALWGTRYDPDSSEIPCDFAPTVTLQCLRRNGGWNELDGLNAPVVMELWDDSPSPFFAVLERKNAGAYELMLDDERLTVTPRDFRDIWFGSYILLWQTPPSYSGTLRQGDTHSSVAWLRTKLQQLEGRLARTANKEFFGPELHEAVRAFQATEGLVADGVVGPLTWIRLADRLGLGGPKLDA
jgi:general secretion pathway protein A